MKGTREGGGSRTDRGGQLIGDQINEGAGRGPPLMASEGEEEQEEKQG